MPCTAILKIHERIGHLPACCQLLPRPLPRCSSSSNASVPSHAPCPHWTHWAAGLSPGAGPVAAAPWAGSEEEKAQEGGELVQLPGPSPTLPSPPACSLKVQVPQEGPFLTCAPSKLRSQSSRAKSNLFYIVLWETNLVSCSIRTNNA